MKKLLAKADTFLFAPASPEPLVALRILVALLLLVQAFLLSGELTNFFGQHGMLQTALTDLFIADTYMPRLHQLTEAVQGLLGISESAAITVWGLVYAASLVLILLGRFTRPAAAAACLLHVVFLTTGYYTAYGVDRFTQICLFYFILFPTSTGAPSSSARFAVRILQFHLCVAYVSTGIEKIVGVQWRDGEAVFRAMMLPSFNQFNVLWIAYHPWIGKLLCWGTLVLEIGYGVFIWPRFSRKWWILGVESLHLGIAVFMGLYFFAAAMGILTFCCFGIPMWAWKGETAAGSEAGGR